MKIQLVITELNMGGAEKALSELASGLQQRGHLIRVLSIGSQPLSPRDRLVQRLRGSGVEIEFGGYDHPTQMFAALRWLTKRLKHDPPEICQTFLFHANCLGSWASRLAGASHRVAGLRVAEWNPLRCRLERIAIRHVDRVVCVSNQVREFAVQRLSVAPQTCVVIPNGVDAAAIQAAEPFRWETIGWPAESQVALFVGRLHPQKGIELLQQQWSRLFEGHPNRRLLLVGDGPLRESISRWAELRGRDRVQVLPWQADVAPLLKAAALLVLPSHYEGMPNVVLEAMAAGRPVVCSLVHGSEELLRSDDDGSSAVDRSIAQGFPPGDSAAMADLVDAFFRDPQRGDTLGHMNRQHVQRHFTYDQMVDRYESLYESLLR